jgi:serine/threonine protein phosphatase PrpC
MANNKDSRKKIFPFDLIEAPKRCYQFKLAFASAPHPHKVWKGGEDALFVSKNIILIADGVGGWAKMGIDSGVYARRLVASVKELIFKEKEMHFIEHP